MEDTHPSGFARWIIPAIVVSALFHLGLVFWAMAYPVKRLGDAYFDRIVPRKFHVERVEIDPALLEESPTGATPEPVTPVPVPLPDETVVFDAPTGEIRATPAVGEFDPSQLEAGRPDPASELQSALRETEARSTALLTEELEAMREQLIEDRPTSEARPAMTFTDLAAGIGAEGEADATTGAAGEGTPGFTDLDQLLAQTGPLERGTAPILMPSELLFDYDEYALKPQAIESLTKLGRLIRRNPGAQFVIEGHTDSFGPEEYNLELSERRAQSVKQWLAQEMEIEETRMRAIGFGMSRLIAPADGSIDDQAINRRVEIVIRFPGGGD